MEKAWKGFVDNFEDKGAKIYFKVNIEKEIQIPHEYISYQDGWYIDLEGGGPEEDGSDEMGIYPPFFEILKTTNNWQKFEDLTFLLLKLLGVHNIYKYEQQRGTADGFFKFQNLFVVYDCTLESDFEKFKGSQIDNFSAQLKTGTLSHQKRVMNISNCHRQVWIITRGSSRMIKKVDDVLIREVPIDKIVQIYRNRLENDIDENTLEIQLGEI